MYFHFIFYVRCYFGGLDLSMLYHGYFTFLGVFED
jgi:hypothetical protein